MSDKEPDPTFEDAIERLESLITAMESGEIPLAEMVAKFEEGSNLLKLCQGQLKEAEMTINKLDPKTGRLEAFDPSAGEEAP